MVRERDRIISLLWPTQLVGVDGVYFRGGLPVGVTLDAYQVGRFAPQLWARAPIDEVNLRDGETELAFHPVLARATSLRTSQGPHVVDLGPLFGREGSPWKSLSFVWNNRRVPQLRRLARPGALHRLELHTRYEANKPMLMADDIDGLFDLGILSLRELVLSSVMLRQDGLEALARTQWPLETLVLEEAAGKGTVAALAASPLLANVQSLVIRRTKLRKDEAANLRAAFERLPGVRQLVIE